MKRNLGCTLGIVMETLAISCSSQAPIDEDAVRISPEYYTVRFENDRVRVFEYRLQPGESEPMHSHPPGVVYYLSDATFVITFPDGRSAKHSVTTGEVEWREFTRHAGENTGNTEAHVLVIELKSTAP